MRITIAIPTKNRKDKVVRLLNCLSSQTINDFNIMVADASERSTDYNSLFGGLRIEVFQVLNGNLPRQRRLLIDRCKTEYIGFLDDDVTVDNIFIESALAVIRSDDNSQLAGFSGFVENRPIPEYSLKKVFRRMISGVYIGSPGRLTPGGIAVPLSKRPKSEVLVDYLQGPCMILKLDCVSSTQLNSLYEMYDEKQGRAEDIALSSLAARRGSLKVIPSITVTHNMEGGGSPIAKKGFNKGVADTYGRFYVSKLSVSESKMAWWKVYFYWYCLMTNIVLNPVFINDSEYRSGVIHGLKRSFKEEANVI